MRQAIVTFLKAVAVIFLGLGGATVFSVLLIAAAFFIVGAVTFAIIVCGIVLICTGEINFPKSEETKL